MPPPSTSHNTSPADAADVWPLFWHSTEGSGRNEFCIFERVVHLDAVPESSWIEIFADTRFRLLVNERVVSCGPPRFLPSHPVCVRQELDNDLNQGKNLLRVEVNSRGAPSYQAVCGEGGLALRGRIGEIVLDLPRDWIVKSAPGWDPEAEPFSFAQGPVEIRDLRAVEIPRGVPVNRANRARWGEISPSPIAPPTLQFRKFTRIVRCGALEKHRIRRGFRGPEEAGGRLPFCFHIFSPHAQTITATLSWGPVSLNGRWLNMRTTPNSPNQETARLGLLPGWNFCFGMPELLKSHWVWQIETPGQSELKLAATPGAQASFLIGRPVHSAAVIDALFGHPPGTVDEIPFDRSEWTEGGSDRPPSPAKELSWDRMAGDLIPPGSSFDAPVVLPATDDHTMVLDLESEYLGFPVVEIEAPRGTIMDVGYDERLNDAGTPAYFWCNPFVNAADRFVLREGLQKVEGFHPRGGRYLQITIRNARGPVRILEAGIRSACGAYAHEGILVSGDRDIDWAWTASERTLFASLADGWIDPWREQGMYLGDVLVQAHATRKITPDWSLDPWSLRLWSHAQFPDGQLPDVVPSPHVRPLIDYTLIWIVALRNYWAESGDIRLASELWPTVTRILSSPSWITTSKGLWEVGPEQTAFIDWGATPEECTGLNACLNAFRYRALVAAAEVAEAAGNGESAAEYSRQSAKLKTAFQDVFWNEKDGRFLASIRDGVPSSGPSLHATALALAFGLDNGDPRAADYLAENLTVDDRFPEGRIEAYFLYYVLSALWRAGRVADAENAIRNYYGYMRARGAWTLWERLQQGATGKDSLCHGWSSGAVPFLAECTLGVRTRTPGDPARIVIAPEAETLDAVSGRVAHPHGPITVAWKVRDGSLHIDVRHPRSVEITFRPSGRLSGLPLVANTHPENPGGTKRVDQAAPALSPERFSLESLAMI